MKYVLTLLLFNCLYIPVLAQDRVIHSDSFDSFIENNFSTEKSYQKICLHKTTQLNNFYILDLPKQKINWRKGDISRLFFLCESKYDVQLTSGQRRGFEIWDIKDPVSLLECAKEQNNKKLNKETNPYVINRCSS